MTISDETRAESRVFEADVAKLLHLMVHSVYSDKSVFLRELISNAADACEKLRYEAIANPALLGDDPKPHITLAVDPDDRTLTVEDNGIGMSRDEMVEALGTIARSGTRAFLERVEAAKSSDGATLIGQFGIGFYSAFMVADRVDVFSRRAGSRGGMSVVLRRQGHLYGRAGAARRRPGARHPRGPAPDGGRQVLHRALHPGAHRQGAVRPCAGSDRHRREARRRTRRGRPMARRCGPSPSPRSPLPDYADFYRSLTGQFDEPALTVHFRAEGRHEYSALIFVPGSRPFDLFDPDRTGRVKLYVKRVFITDEAEILPRYLRFARGAVDSADLPLNVSREMIQESPILAAIKKGVTSRVLGDLEKLAEKEPESYDKIWDLFGPVLKEGLYEDFERRDALLALARFKTTASAGAWRSLKDYAAALKENQTAIYYLAGDDIARLENSPHLEGFRARGVEVLYLADPVDSFWVTSAPSFEGKPFKSVTQGAADLALIPRLDAKDDAAPASDQAITDFLAFTKTALGDAVADVRVSDRLTDSAVCLVAAEHGPDRQLERVLASAGRINSAAKPILEVNPRHQLIVALAALSDDQRAFKEDAAHLLFDEARVLDGERPADARGFSDRLARVLERGLRTTGA